MLRTFTGKGTPSAHAAVICLVSALVTLLALADGGKSPAAVGAVALAQVVLAVVAWRLTALDGSGEDGEPWRASVGAAMLVLLALTTWVSDAFASGVGPVYVLVFAWFGLHCRPRNLFIAITMSTAGYLGAMMAVDARTRQLLSTLVLIPVATVVALLIAAYTREQRALRRDLEMRERWRTALMATLAHDVRSPLSTVTGTIEILQDDPGTDERYQPLLASAMRQSGRVLKLASGLLEMERVEHGQLVLDHQPVPVEELAEHVAVLSQPDAVQVDVEPGLQVHADPERLEQVIYNLVINALRHGRPPVVISGRARPEGVEIAVEDQGDGVPEEDLPFLFERFSSADRAPSSVGLGLWIVRTLVEAHGGTVHYEERAGARFVVTLPHAPGPAPRGTGEVVADSAV
jgi:signal transduction histidine kinase